MLAQLSQTSTNLTFLMSFEAICMICSDMFYVILGEFDISFNWLCLFLYHGLLFIIMFVYYVLLQNINMFITFVVLVNS